MIYKRTTDASTEPITLAEALEHLRQSSGVDDDTVTRLIKASRKWAEAYTERSFITQTWKAYGDSFPAIIELMHGPVISVTSVSYIDGDGNTQTLVVDTDYKVDLHSDIARITAVNSWPNTKEVVNAVTVTYTAGFGAAAAVPEDIKAAILLVIGRMYENREDSVHRYPTASQNLLGPYKVYHNLN